MKSRMLLILGLLGLLLACAPVPIERTIDIALKEGEPETYDMYFITSAQIDSAYEYASTGPVLGATIVTFTVSSNRDFFITGARIENLEYYLGPIGGANPAGSGYVPYSHYDSANGCVLNPIFVSVPVLGGDSGGGTIHVQKDTVSTLEVYPVTKLSYWSDLDTDRDGTKFIADDNEVIQLRCSLFLEGFLEDGTEFSGFFPEPLGLQINISHQ